jgi:hypothetical protein
MPSSSQSGGTRRILYGPQNLNMKAVWPFEKSVAAYLLTQLRKTDDFNSYTNTCVFNPYPANVENMVSS